MQYQISDIIEYYEGGALKYSFAIILIIALVFLWLFRKKLPNNWARPLILLVVAFAVLLTDEFVIGTAQRQVSIFSVENWESYEYLRQYMMEDLENQHKIIGKTKEEITALLGEPGHGYKNDEDVFEYVIGWSVIDPYMYVIEFENDIAVSTECTVLG